jgi:predicted AAA+ superfamily ATPase
LAEKQDFDSRVSKMTNDQKKVFDFVSERLDGQVLAFVSGPRETGKSFLLHIL